MGSGIRPISKSLWISCTCRSTIRRSMFTSRRFSPVCRHSSRACLMTRTASSDTPLARYTSARASSASASPRTSPSSRKSCSADLVVFRASVAFLSAVWIWASTRRVRPSPSLSSISRYSTIASLAASIASLEPRTLWSNPQAASSCDASSSFHPTALYSCCFSLNTPIARSKLPRAAYMVDIIVSRSATGLMSLSTTSRTTSRASRVASKASSKRPAEQSTSATSCRAQALTCLSADPWRSPLASSALCSASSSWPADSCRLTIFWKAANSRRTSPAALATLASSLSATIALSACSNCMWICAITSSASRIWRRWFSSRATSKAWSIEASALTGLWSLR
mmetsp:Transcript_89187/g.252884  ORF Transcript_89187/g.252884 Transcript_89187/m.252884 type:complete len:340 (-) Transcript_89187:594-1613(-)